MAAPAPRRTTDVSVHRGTIGRIVLLSTLYFAQGLPFGIFMQALPVLMRREGQSLEHIGLTNLLALPWVLKFLWAPAIDWVGGPRRRVIIPLNLATAGLLLALALVSPGSLVPLLVVVFLCNLVAATQDIATDGLAVETLPPDERGLGNGVQVAGYRLGMVLGGGVLVQLFDAWGWFESFATAAAAIVLVTVPVALLPASPRPARGDRKGSSQALRWDRWFGGPGGPAWFGLLVVYKLGDSLGTSMVKPMLVDQGLTLAEIGGLMGVWGSVAGLSGALLGGFLVSRTRRRTALLAFACLQLPTLAAYGWIAHAGPELLVPVVIAEHLCSGMATAALFTAMMDACRPGHAGSDYTVQASVVVAAQGLAAILSGYSAATLGYEGHFAAAVVLAALAVLVVVRVERGEGRFRLA
ncbi:MAG: MFS transporter [Myxococcales bacterium]|nr:MFS transporter [Myxococcales bacterium]